MLHTYNQLGGHHHYTPLEPAAQLVLIMAWIRQASRRLQLTRLGLYRDHRVLPSNLCHPSSHLLTYRGCRLYLAVITRFTQKSNFSTRLRMEHNILDSCPL